MDSHATLHYVLVILTILRLTNAGPMAYGICQTGYKVLGVACYAAAGFVFGTVTADAGIPLVIFECNAALGTCMITCVVAGFAPIL
jgi:hypothetical protein